VSRRPPELLGFKSKVRWDGATGGEAYVKSFPPLRFDTSKEYGGPGGRDVCPDELFLTSIAACTLTTFLYFKSKLSLDLRDLVIDAHSQVKLTREGYRIAEVRLAMSLKVAKGQAEVAKRCVELVSKYCHIKRSVEPSIPVSLDAAIEEV